MSNENNIKFMSDWIKTQFKVEEQIESNRRKVIKKQQQEASINYGFKRTAKSLVIFNPEEKINDNK